MTKAEPGVKDDNGSRPLPPKWDMTGLIDFGDLMYSCVITDLAIAMAYHMLGQANHV